MTLKYLDLTPDLRDRIQAVRDALAGYGSDAPLHTAGPKQELADALLAAVAAQEARRSKRRPRRRG